MSDDRNTGNYHRPPKNPVAVALQYDPLETDAPRVSASGRGHVAERILREAFDHGVKVREDPELADLLATVDVDSEIPLEAFAAVAEILAYVYRAEGRNPPDPAAVTGEDTA